MSRYFAISVTFAYTALLTMVGLGLATLVALAVGVTDPIMLIGAPSIMVFALISLAFAAVGVLAKLEAVATVVDSIKGVVKNTAGDLLRALLDAESTPPEVRKACRQALAHLNNYREGSG